MVVIKRILIPALALLVLASGCGRKVKYDLPVGKSMVYVVTEQPGKEEEGKVLYSAPVETMEVNLRIKQRLSGNTAVTMTARPMPGKSHPMFGRDLGKLDILIGGNGKLLNVEGMGLPQEIRFFLPEFPVKMKKKAFWTEKIRVRFKSNEIDADLRHEFLGTREAAGRKCFFFKGTANYAIDEKVVNRDAGVNATLKYNFDYEENYYFDVGRGYVVKTEIFEKRRRNVIDNLTGRTELDAVDMNRKTLELAAVED